MSLNEEYELELFQTVKYDPESDSIYIVANRLHQQLGLYILNISIKNPYKTGSGNNFIIKRKQALETGDCAINILRD